MHYEFKVPMRSGDERHKTASPRKANNLFNCDTTAEHLDQPPELQNGPYLSGPFEDEILCLDYSRN